MAETPATALQELLNSLPEGADPFAAIASLLTEQVCPTLSKAFNAQVCASIAFLSLITISLMTSLFIRLYRRRFKLVIKDGSLTRLDHKIWVPILWTLEAFFNLVLNPLYRHEAQTKSFSASLGRLLLLIHMPLVVSYAMLTGNVVASAPAVRRQFSKVRHGSLYFNAGLAALTFGMCASIFPSAFQVGDALKRVSASYAEIMQILEQGSVSENLAMLMDIAEPPAPLDQAALDISNATWRGSVICITYVFFFLMAGVLPGWLLGRYVTRKITALE